MRGFCLVVELAQEESVTIGATMAIYFYKKGEKK